MMLMPRRKRVVGERHNSLFPKELKRWRALFPANQGRKLKDIPVMYLQRCGKMTNGKPCRRILDHPWECDGKESEHGGWWTLAKIGELNGDRRATPQVRASYAPAVAAMRREARGS